jgi:hypothetical protein
MFNENPNESSVDFSKVVEAQTTTLKPRKIVLANLTK